MAKTPENTIVAKLAMFKDLRLDAAISEAIGLEVSPFPFLESDVPKPPAAWVIGTSLRDIWEGAFNEKCRFGGPNADMAIEQAFKLKKVAPIVVSEENFEKLRELRKKVSPKKFNQAIQQLFALPLEVSIEK